MSLANVVDAVEWIGFTEAWISLKCALLMSNLDTGSLLLIKGVTSVPSRLIAKGSLVVYLERTP